jgi:hypothetical protein
MTHNNNAYGFFFGLIGGGVKYMMNINAEIISRMSEAAVTAIMCGFLGMLGKEAFVYIKRKYFTKKHK